MVHRRPDPRQEHSSLKSDQRGNWLAAYRAVWAETERRAAPLSAGDQVVKSMPDVEWEAAARGGQLSDEFGLLWQWTRSAHAPYPEFVAADVAVGEYNGKFVVNQLGRRPSWFATPEGHARVSYRNFLYPPARWQFSELRLADYRR
jgi:formylglycine-generating enzyme required for sulfatase activity